MNRTLESNPLSWTELGVLALLGGVFLYGLAACGLTLMQSMVTLGFAAGVLLMAWLWQLTLQRAQQQATDVATETQPPTDDADVPTTGRPA